MGNIAKFYVDREGNFVLLETPDWEEQGDVVEVNKSGGVIWKFPSEELGIVDMTMLNDGYVVVGRSWNDLTGVYDMVIVKIAENGRVVWRKIYSRFVDIASGLFPLSIASIENGFVMTGFTTNESAYSYPGPDESFDVFVAKFNENGEFISVEKFGGSDGDMGIILSTIDEDRVVVVGLTKSEDGDVDSEIDELAENVWIFGVSMGR